MALYLVMRGLPTIMTLDYHMVTSIQLKFLTVFLGVELDTPLCQMTLLRPKLDDLHTLVFSAFYLNAELTNTSCSNWLIINCACRVVYGGRNFLRRVLDTHVTSLLPRPVFPVNLMKTCNDGNPSSGVQWSALISNENAHQQCGHRCLPDRNGSIFTGETCWIPQFSGFASLPSYCCQKGFALNQSVAPYLPGICFHSFPDFTPKPTSFPGSFIFSPVSHFRHQSVCQQLFWD